ncbi:MAG TPA: DUF58 domain-containing protein [Candidatus Binataceae bacterium]
MLAERAFEPDFLAKLDRLIIGIRRARTARHGQRTAGRIQGVGLEVENFRDYTEGDDFRFLDWNAAARLDELYVKMYRTEREVETTILVDASASMGTYSADDKLGLALAIASSLAYVAMANSDAVRIATFAARPPTIELRATEFRRRRESYPGLRPFVLGTKSAGKTAMPGAVEKLLLGRRQAGMVIVVSDFMVNAGEYEDALSRLIAARHEVKVVQVLGERESSGSWPPGLYKLRDAESGSYRDFAVSAAAVAAYRAKLESLLGRLKDFCADHAIKYAAAFGAGNLDQTVRREFPRLGVVR